MDIEQKEQTVMEVMKLPNNQCSPCSKNNERVKAVKYCIECRDFYCRTCVDRHTWFPALRNHTLYNAEDRAGTHTPELSVITLACDKHKSETIDAYCPQHDDVLCAKCLKENHSSCSNVVGLVEAAIDLSRFPNMAEVVAGSLKVDQRLEETRDTLNEELEHLNQSKDKAIVEVKEYRGELHLTLLQLDGQTIEYVREMHDKLAAKLLNQRELVENHKYALQPIMFQHAIPFTSPEKQFVALHQQKKKLTNAKEILDSMTRTGRFEIKFTADPDIKAFLRHQLALGKIEALKNTKLYTLSHVNKLYVKNTAADRIRCYIDACCITLDGQYFLITDCNNRNVKRFEARNFLLKDYCNLPDSPNGICCLSLEEAAVIVYQRGIYLLSLVDGLHQTRIIDIDHYCHDLVCCNEKLYVTTRDDKICMYDLNGQLIKTINTDKSGNKIFVDTRNIAADEKDGRIYVADYKKGLVILNTNGEHIVTITHQYLKYPHGVCTDGKGCVFVSGHTTILQYDQEYGKLTKLVKVSIENNGNDIYSIRSICFVENYGRKCLIVSSMQRPYDFSDYVHRCFLDKLQR